MAEQLAERPAPPERPEQPERLAERPAEQQGSRGSRRRRGHGEGSITQLPDGRWQARLTVGYDPRGRQKRRAFYGKTRKEVQAKLARALAEHQQGLPLPPERQTVAQFLTQWLEQTARPAIRPRTYATYAFLLRKHILPELGRVPLARLGPQHLQAFLHGKQEAGLSARTCQHLHALLRVALGQAEHWHLIVRNPARLVRPPKGEQREVRPFQVEEVQRLLAAARGDRLEALYVMAASMGLRQGELLGLRWADLDQERGTLTVRVQLQRIEGALRLVEPKTASSRRTLQLPSLVVAALRAHRQRQLEERLAVGPAWQDTGLVFCTSVGSPIDPRNLIRHYHRLLQQAGVPRRPFHTLRHTAASLLLASGLELRVIQQVLGHSQISLTANLYSHVLPVLLASAAERMDHLLRETRPS